MGLFDRFKKKQELPEPQATEPELVGDEQPEMHASQPLEEPATLADAARQAHRAREFRGRETPADSALLAEAEGLPSVNRRKRGNQLVNVLGIVAIIGVGAVLAATVNSKKGNAPKKAKDQPAEAVSALPPLVMPPPPPPIATGPGAGVQRVSWSGEGQGPQPSGAATASGTGGRPTAPAGAIPVQGTTSAKPQEWWERRLTGDMVVSDSGGGLSGGSAPATAGAPGGAAPGARPSPYTPGRPSPYTPYQPAAANGAAPAPAPAMAALLGGEGGQGEGRNELTSRLRPSAMKGTAASVLPDRNFVITKGTRDIDCVIEQKIDTTLPGLLRCRVDQDVYSSNGAVLLIERGSWLVGEQQGNVRQGQARVFGLFDRIETPNGVIIDINSPATDELGAPGIEGWVDNHFAQRFGAAILMTFIQDSLKAVIAREQSNGGTVLYSNTADAGAKVVEKILDSTANIPPTLVRNAGAHIKVSVARDLDFSGVYALQVKQ